MLGLKLQAYTMRSGLRTAVTLLVALAAAQLCVWLHTPIPWMLGPLLVTALASVLGAPTSSAPLLRNAGQWVIGVVLGLYFTPQVGALVVSLWWAIALAVLWALLLGALFDAWLQHRHRAELAHLPPSAWRATTYFASAIGGASEMTLLAERHGARTDRVAAALCHAVGTKPLGFAGRCTFAARSGGGALARFVLAGAVHRGWRLGHVGFQADQSLVHGGFAGLDGLDAVGGALVGCTHGIVERRAVGHRREPGGALSA
jgi:membrane AbrB-like protein